MRKVMLDIESGNKFLVSISNNGYQWTGALLDTYENCKKILDTFISIGFEDDTDYKKVNAKQKFALSEDSEVKG